MNWIHPDPVWLSVVTALMGGLVLLAAWVVTRLRPPSPPAVSPEVVRRATRRLRAANPSRPMTRYAAERALRDVPPHERDPRVDPLEGDEIDLPCGVLVRIRFVGPLIECLFRERGPEGGFDKHWQEAFGIEAWRTRMRRARVYRRAMPDGRFVYV